MTVAIFKHQNPKKKWCILLPNGRKICGYDTADKAREVAARCGKVPVVLDSRGGAELVAWKYGKSGRLEFWRAEVGGQILATAERSDPEDFWQTTILGKQERATASITELAQMLNLHLKN